MNDVPSVRELVDWTREREFGARYRTVIASREIRVARVRRSAVRVLYRDGRFEEVRR